MIYVRDVMTRGVKTIDLRSTILDAAKAMAKWKIGSLVVVEGTKPVGMVTEGDISRSVADGVEPSTALGKFGMKRLLTVAQDEKVEVAAKMMSAARVKKLPVMEGGALVGIITQTDIVGSTFSLVTSLKEMVEARYRPPDFEM